ncbi:Serine chemoreceptor protein [Serratia entomophila]|uniref:methyl-accepting chemotaxis protein n=1 Tax=Serratia entomophila TaxID=42906 RepID=UPI001F284A4A|nr:methyl-accepting chemotaxis protein [Serratia entomophila]UIW18657.1 Tar ligand binding domain-containing protein [Serratia entomophila]CAI0820904.1 Serine chemoreceptor protein [Serratia entomophila]CAI0834555.1 Serine chemoreceptor protein [Serratia entomophila]CAI0838934.1 Serine chemoreceptor protein [Serratia entomophila]CAI0881410.1 Serine chemoreceptor protein [Serratia entomophila]
MLKNMNIATWLMLMLLLLGLMPMGTGGIAFYFMQQNGSSIGTMGVFSAEEAALNRSWRALLQTQTLIDNMAFERMAPTAAADIRQGIHQARSELRSADVAFNLFWATPGLTVSRPELGEAMKKVYLAQQRVLKRELALLETAPQATLLDSLHQMMAEKSGVRQRLDAQFADYMKATVVNHRLALEEAQQTQRVFARLLSGTLAAILALLVLVHRDFRRRLITPLRQVADHLQKVGRGDLRSEIRLHSRNEIGMLFASLQKMQQELSATVRQVREGVESINLGTHEIAVGNADLSSRTEEQASALTQTAASMEQITATVRQNADNAGQAALMVNQTSVIAHDGEALMGSLVNKMRVINDSARQVGEITSVIDGIAFQTNILALNAAVEAARAGEQGRGFAVVAGEVRSLAQRCAASAKEISSLVDGVAADIGEGVQLVERAGNAMNEIVVSVTKVNSLMGSISYASEEQSKGVEQVGIAITQMDQVTQQNAALVEEVATTAASVEEQAALLAQAVAVFQLTGELLRQGAEERPAEEPVGGWA